MVSLMIGDGGVAVCVSFSKASARKLITYLDLYLAEALCHQREQGCIHMFAVSVTEAQFAQNRDH